MVSAAIAPKGRKKTDKTKTRTVNKADFFIEPPLKIVLMLPSPDETELKIEDLWMSLRSVLFKMEKIP